MVIKAKGQTSFGRKSSLYSTENNLPSQENKSILILLGRLESLQIPYLPDCVLVCAFYAIFFCFRLYFSMYQIQRPGGHPLSPEKKWDIHPPLYIFFFYSLSFLSSIYNKKTHYTMSVGGSAMPNAQTRISHYNTSTLTFILGV